MSTSEGISLQAVDSKEAEDGSHTPHTVPLELDDTSQSRNLSRSKTAASVTMSQWMKIFTTVTTLIASAFLFGGVSMIGPFYPIVVSFVDESKEQSLNTLMYNLGQPFQS